MNANPDAEDSVYPRVISSEFGRNRITQIEDDVVLKQGSSVWPNEEAALNLVKSSATDVPVPTFYHAIYDRGTDGIVRIGMMYMEFIPGESLESAWPRLSDGNRKRICRETWSLIDKLRLIPRPENATHTGNHGEERQLFYCAADGTPCIIHPLLGNVYDRPPPLLDDETLRARIWDRYVEYNGLSYPDGHSVKDILPRSQTAVFTHGDIHPGNILVNEDQGDGNNGQVRIVALVDFESSGFFPDYWEYAQIMRFRGGGDDDESVKAADWWDDFSNNLATDLSPLLALFGEQVTQQFLSESTSILDNFIFAMAPLGIVTAVVSVIRVCGGPSLRAFIGRAQEGGGIAEAELCSSTSRDVCELYHRGAIVRVFGRPKILEVVHDPAADDFYYRCDRQGRLRRPRHGIYLSQEYLEGKSIETSMWEEVGEQNDIEARKQGPVKFAPNPNLSFNIGTTRRPPWVYLLASGLGILTQAFVVIFGGLATYLWQWQKENGSPPRWAFPVMAAGTISLSFGMFFCAFLIDRSTSKRVFRKRRSDQKYGEATEGIARKCQSTIYIVQPGNQSISDQNYDAFAFSDASKPLKEYTTSWKRKDSYQPGDQWLVWFAIGFTILGFGLQFVGLRAMHSSVSMVLLVAILVMSIMRSILRTGRLKKEQNLLRNRPDDIEGHELDWLAIEMTYGALAGHKDGGPWFLVSGPSPQDGSKGRSLIDDVREGVSPRKTASSLASVSPCQSVSTLPCLDPIEVVEEKDNGKALLCAFYDPNSNERLHEQEIEKNLRLAEAHWQSESGWRSRLEYDLCSPQDSQPGIAERLFYSRSRLAELTSQSALNKSTGPADWGNRLIPLRGQAQQLKTAIEASTQILFTHCEMHPKWKKARSLAFSLNVMVPSPSDSADSQIHIFMRQPDLKSDIHSAAWEVNRNDLEAVLSLWNWSLVSDHKLEHEDDAGLKTSLASEVPKARLIAVGASEKELKSAQNELDTWSNGLFAFTTTQTWELRQGEDPLGATTVWKKTGDSTSLEPQRGRCNSTKQLIRLFGWPGAGLSNQVSALTIISKLSIPTLCAQEVYQYFIGAMATTLDSIGGITKPRVEDSTRIYLTNDVISRLADSVVSSGLGSQQDAYSILIPILSRRSKLPVPTAILPKVYDIAKESMLSGNFEEAEKNLKWARQVSLQAHAQQQQDSSLRTATLELAEFYRCTWRTSLLEKDCEKRRKVREVGRRGASWLNDITHAKASQPCPDEIREMVGRYTKLSKEWDIQIIQSDAPASEVLRFLFANRLSLCLALIAEDSKFADEKRRTVLSWAAERGCSKIVELSLAMGSQVDSEDESKRAPLSYAAENGHVDVVRILLQHNAQPLTIDSKRRTPLSYASQNGNTSVLKTLMNYRPATADARDDLGWTPLHWAAQCGMLDAIDLLIAKQFDKDATDHYGRTPLITALINRHEEAAMQLLKRGVTWKIDVGGEEAWKWAFSNGHWSCGEFLLKLVNQEHDDREKVFVRALLIPSEPTMSMQHTKSGQHPFDPERPHMSKNRSAFTIWELTDEGAQRPGTACTLLRVLNRPYYHEIWVGKLDRRDMGDAFSLGVRESCSLTDRVERLLFHLGIEVGITERMILEILRTPPQTGLSAQELTDTLQLLLQRIGPHFVVGRGVVEVAKNGNLAKSALSILLKREWQNGNFSTDILGELMCISRIHGLKTMKEYLENQGEGFDVADDLFIAVLEHEQDDQTGLKLLLNYRKKGVTAKTLSTVLQKSPTRKGGLGGKGDKEIGDNIRHLFYLHDMGEIFKIEGLDS